MAIEQQTYEINVDENSLILMNEEDIAESLAGPNQLVFPYRNVKKTLFNYLDTLEKSNRFYSIVLYSKDVQLLFEDLKSLLLWVPAAGGVIENHEKKILMIFRKGFWDLPKGKLDSNEKSKSAAVRECMEETGLHNISLHSKLAETWHIYREKSNQRALKRTKWYFMSYADHETPIPQIEENIEIIEWLTFEEAMQKKPIHKNILLVLQKYQEMKGTS
ncbi:MAG: NUDIX domain-containing protein [Saprospiraceae bacterium]|nr:NUDIX domain-containing protein [Saprospiraceae bacterium]MBK9728112.1 NUDIX domain-containing protein [Saprospiraceae bacterium]